MKSMLTLAPVLKILPSPVSSTRSFGVTAQLLPNAKSSKVVLLGHI